MDTTRQQKISRLVQKELSEIFRRETAKTRGTLVSVSSVRVSPDLSVANVRLSIFPSENAQAIMERAQYPPRAGAADALPVAPLPGTEVPHRRLP